MTITATTAFCCENRTLKNYTRVEDIAEFEGFLHSNTSDGCVYYVGRFIGAEKGKLRKLKEAAYTAWEMGKVHLFQIPCQRGKEEREFAYIAIKRTHQQVKRKRRKPSWVNNKDMRASRSYGYGKKASTI